MSILTVPYEQGRWWNSCSGIEAGSVAGISIGYGVFGIWDGVRGIWDGVLFGIWDGVST